MSRIWRHLQVSKLKYSPITVKLAIFKMAATKLLVNISNQNSRPENSFKRYNITNLLVQNSLPANLFALLLI